MELSSAYTTAQGMSNTQGDHNPKIYIIGSCDTTSEKGDVMTKMYTSSDCSDAGSNMDMSGQSVGMSLFWANGAGFGSTSLSYGKLFYALEYGQTSSGVCREIATEADRPIALAQFGKISFNGGTLE